MTAAVGLACLGLAAVPAAVGTADAATTATASAAPSGRYVVRAQAGALPTLLGDLHSHGLAVVRTITLLDTAVVTATQPQAQALAARPEVAALTPDGDVTLAGDSYDATGDPASTYSVSTLVGARGLWAAGATGDGVDVALIDSGVTRVDGLGDGKVVAGADLTTDAGSTDAGSADAGSIDAGSTDGLGAVDDGFGHGTFMAGLIAAKDAAAGGADDTGAYQGMAPDARIVSVKVADADGRTAVSQVIEGIAWAVEHAHDGGRNIRVMNLSFGADAQQSYLVDPLAFAAEMAWRHGIVVVASAGNTGRGALSDPASDPFVLAVGALDSTAAGDGSGHVAAFSRWAPSGRTVDLVAPGVSLQGLRVPGSTIDAEVGPDGGIGTRFVRGSGTSEAAAVTSGAAALLLSARPGLSPDQVKAILTGAADPTDDIARAQGRGALDVAGTLDAPVRWGMTQRFTLSRGTARYHGDQPSGSGASWAGASWNGASWAGASWNGASWAGASWAGASWAGASWSGAAWAGESWS